MSSCQPTTHPPPSPTFRSQTDKIYESDRLKNTAGEILKKSASFSIGSTVHLSCLFKTAIPVDRPTPTQSPSYQTSTIKTYPAIFYYPPLLERKAIDSLVLLHCPHDAHWNCDRPSDEQRGKRQQQSRRNPLPQDLRYRTLGIGKANAKIEPRNHLPQPQEILLHHWLIQPKLLLKLLQGFL